jgi:hypothetical protein
MPRKQHQSFVKQTVLQQEVLCDARPDLHLDRCNVRRRMVKRIPIEPRDRLAVPLLSHPGATLNARAWQQQRHIRCLQVI